MIVHSRLIDVCITPTGGAHKNQRRHYVDHVAPIWKSLPEKYRGNFICLPTMADYAAKKGIIPTVYNDGNEMLLAMQKESRLTLVAGHGDPVWLNLTKRPNAITMHGVGFVFDADRKHVSYPGSNCARDRTVLMLSASERIASLEREGNPNMAVEVVGCPKLDEWHLKKKKRANRKNPTIALAWHWRCGVAPETQTAFDYYYPVLSELASRYNVIGHGHPHIIDELGKYYHGLGIEVVRQLDEVFERADMMIADATSAMFEFASLDRPVVVAQFPLNKRREDFGDFYNDRLRLGVVCESPDNLLDAVEIAKNDPKDVKEERRKLIQECYTYMDGGCAERAANALIKAVEQLEYQDKPAESMQMFYARLRASSNRPRPMARLRGLRHGHR